MSTRLMWGYKRNPLGRIVHKQFDPDDFPSDWTDSPDKIPPLENPVQAHPMIEQQSRQIFTKPKDVEPMRESETRHGERPKLTLKGRG